VVAGLTDPDALRRAAEGADCLIHLAATADDANFPRGDPPNDGDNFLAELVPNNLVGPYQVLETARRLKLKRVVLASTGQVVDGYFDSASYPITATAMPRPRYLYACTKVFLEALGQVYAAQHGMAVLAVRLGWCPRDARQVAEIQQDPEAQDVFLSPGDAGRFFAAAVEVPSLPPYAIVYATSRPTHLLRYDLGPAARLLGYEPQDCWPTGAEEFS
jgi:nucleoside-diphosphate-sugar epimerase